DATTGPSACLSSAPESERAHRLRRRTLAKDRGYVDVDAAQRFTDETLITKENQRKISDWLAKGARGPLRLEARFPENTGLHLTRYDFTHGQPTKWVKGVRVVLKADPSAPYGYRVLTSFPQP
ncbi:RNase A-like domain-containing protein, partial [Streptomyces anandii]